MNICNTPIESLLSYRNAIIYYIKNKTIWFYDRVDILGNKALCSSMDFPKYKINGLGRIDYLDENRKYIDHKYYQL